jgi:hypothetical protein
MDDRYRRVFPHSYVPTIYPVLFHDDATGTFPYTVVADGADYVAAYQAATPLTGTNQIRLATKTTTPATGDAVAIWLYTFLTPSKLIRVIAHFKPYGTPPHLLFYLSLYWYDGTNEHLAITRLKTSDGTVAYFGPAPNYTDLSTILFNASPGYWHRIDLSVNMADALYHRLIVDNMIAEMQSIAVPTSASATKPALKLRFTLETTSDALAYCALDHILVLAENP